jgi:hypothetical protein
MAAKKKKTASRKKSPAQNQRTQPATVADLVVRPPKQLHIDDPNLTAEERQVANAVRELHIAGRTIEMFVAEHKDVMATYTGLADEYNQKLQLAAQLVRAMNVAIDEFTVAGQPIAYDAEALYRRIGPEKFAQIGGSYTQQTVYEIPREKIESAAALNMISPDDVLAVRTVSTRYHMPKAKG